MATRSCCSTPRTAVAGGRSATSAPAPCRSTKRSSASATIHTSWNCARLTIEPRQRIDTQSEGRSLETTVSGQNVQKIAKDGTARGRPEGGTARAARELPIPGPTEDAKRMAVTRAIKIANIPAEAKEVVKAAGLADNQSALLAVARAEPKD